MPRTRKSARTESDPPPSTEEIQQSQTTQKSGSKKNGGRGKQNKPAVSKKVNVPVEPKAKTETKNKRKHEETEDEEKGSKRPKSQSAPVAEGSQSRSDSPPQLIAFGYEKATCVDFIDGDRMMQMSVGRQIDDEEEEVDYEDINDE